MEILVVAIDRQRYALPLGAVREIVLAVAITRLSGGPSVIAGIINVRGDIVPVMDVRRRFRLPTKTVEPNDHFVIAKAGERTVALHVDSANELATAESFAIQDAKEVAPTSEYLAGVAKLGDGLVLIYDLDAFLSRAEAEALDEALAVSTSLTQETR